MAAGIIKSLRSFVQKLCSLNLLALEIIALRQQIAVYKRQMPRPIIRERDRIFWVLLSKLWHGWKDAVHFVSPDTIVKWQRRGLREYLKRIARQKSGGRRKIKRKVRDLILQMANANPYWGAPRIHGEMKKLGFNVSERSITTIIKKRNRKPPSQSWRAFMDNHLKDLVAIDFMAVPTASFKILFVLIMLSPDRRRVVHFNVTANPHPAWTAQQLVEAFPYDTAPKYIVRDRAGNFSLPFKNRAKGMGIMEVITAYRAPWQNGYVERLIGTIRRDCLDKVIIFNEQHLRRILAEYFEYYHKDRTHLGLDKDTPDGRMIEKEPTGASGGIVASEPRVGGLHHRYFWKKAA